jgi:hypothetical protein
MKNKPIHRRAASGSIRAFACWALLSLLAIAGQASAALSVSPTTVALSTGTYVTAQISGATGTIEAQSGNTGVASVTLSAITNSGATLTVFGQGAGNTTLSIRDRRSNVSVAVNVVASNALAVSPTSLSIAVQSNAVLTASKVSGRLTASSSATNVASVTVAGNVVTVRGLTPGSALVTLKDSRTTVTVPVTVTGTGTTTGSAKYSLLAWNDLGMHRVDGKDYSMFSILPPYNNLHAQLVNAGTGKVVTTGVTLTYEAVADTTGSINTSSATKTNFWTWSKILYGASPAPNVGLTGFSTPSLTAKPLVFNATNGWFEATGILRHLQDCRQRCQWQGFGQHRHCVARQ